MASWFFSCPTEFSKTELRGSDFFVVESGAVTIVQGLGQENACISPEWSVRRGRSSRFQ
jgi:hypothetical protein